MSVEAISWALKQKVGSSSAKALLIVMANMANEHGLCYPSQKYLSESVEQDIKTIQKNINYLRDAGFIVDTGEREGSTKQIIVFRISMLEAPPKTDELNTPKNGRHPKTEDIQNSVETPPNFPLNTPKNGGRKLKETKGNESNTSIKPDDPVVIVFDFWKTTMNSPRSVLDKTRKRRIEGALKNFSIDDLKKAITGCRDSPWNMGENPQRTKYNGVDVIFRDAENIERFMSLAPKESTKEWWAQ